MRRYKLKNVLIEVPTEIGNDPEAVNDHVLDEALKRDLIPFDPRELSAEEAASRVADLEDLELLGFIRANETRVTVQSAAEARADELLSDDEEE